MKRTTTKYNQHFRFIVGFLLSLLLGMYSESIKAQTYPVQANVYLMPPYGKHLNDYYTTSKEKLVVSLLNRDQQKPVLEVRLRMSITASNGLKLQSKEEINYPTITLDANIPTRLTQEDLAPYFQYINTQGYLDQGKLPDGMVEFTFQVIEKYTGKVLSAPATGRVWLSTQKPPILRLPSRDDAIGYRDPMNLKFQWEPQHKNLSQVEYEFELRELPDNGAAPQSAFMYSPIIHQQRQLYTYLMYDVMMPPLDPNKLYGWRVRAIAKDGIDELNMFDNNGYSEIYWFRTQNNCQAPTALSVDLQNRRFDLKWLPEIGNNEFVVQYRSKYGTSEDWQEIRTYDLNTSIYDMQRGTVYEYRVGAICTSGQPVFTNTGEISIPAVDSTRLANCGVPPTLDLSNKELLPELKVGDRVELSDYPMTVTKVSGSNGRFTGEGWVPVNWLLETKWAVEFSNITVNTDYKMIAGSVRAKYDETEGNIANVDQITEGGADNTKNGIIHTDVELTFSIPENPSFTYNPNSGEITVFDTNGESQNVDAPKGNDGKVVFPFVVKDKDGNLHKIDVPRDENGNPITDEDGNLKKDDNGNVILDTTYLGKQEVPFDEDSFSKKSINTNVGIITFEKGNGAYAFDKWLYIYNDISKIGKKYDHLAALGHSEINNKYDVSWKLLPAGTTDIVEAQLSVNKDFSEAIKKAFDPKQVIFATEQGARFNAEFDGKGRYTISLASGVERDIQEIYALYPINGSSEKFYTLGKLDVITYAKQTRKLVIVSVDGKIPDKQALANKLKEVYAPVGVTWEVSYDDDFKYEGQIKDFFEKGSKLLSAYNDNMNKLQAAYKQYKGSLDGETAYLFLLNDSGDGKNRDTQGFMPGGKQFGYIFLKNIEESKEDVNQVIAHELGHGCWSLSHTFDSTYGEKIEKKDPINLMSYGGGVHIAKWQWDVMDSPAWFTNPLNGDDKGKSQGKLDNLDGIETDGSLIAPNGDIIISIKPYTEQYKVVYAVDKNNPLVVMGIYIYDSQKLYKTYLPKYNEKGIFEDYQEEGGATLLSDENNTDLHIIYYTKSDKSILCNGFIRYNTCGAAVYSFDWKAKESSLTLSELKKELSNVNKQFIKLQLFYGADQSCYSKFILDRDSDSEICDPDEITKGLQYLRGDEIKKLKNDNDQQKLAEKLNSVCRGTFSDLKYEELIEFINILASQNTIKEPSEIAILRLLGSVKSSEYRILLEDLLKPNSINEQVKNNYLHLIDEIHDRSINPFDSNNFTYFLANIGDKLCNSSANITDELRWKYLNLFIKQRFKELQDNNDVDAQFVYKILSNLSTSPVQSEEEAKLFTQMLIDDIRALDDYSIIYEISKIRYENREMFFAFTQSEKLENISNTEKQSFLKALVSLNSGVINLKYQSDYPNWLYPSQSTVITSNGGGFTILRGKLGLLGELGKLQYLTDVWPWSNYLEDNEQTKTQITSNNASQIEDAIRVFKREYENFKPVYTNMLSEEATKLGPPSSSNINEYIKLVTIANLDVIKGWDYETRVKLLKVYFTTENIENNVKIEDTPNFISKILASFDSKDGKIIDRIVNEIGLKVCFDKLKADNQKLFLFWIGSQVMTSGKASYNAEAWSKCITVDGEVINPDSEVLPKLEANLFDWRNLSSQIDGDRVKINGTPYHYYEIIPVYVADDFLFYGVQYKKGDLITIPVIQVIALADANTREAIEKGAWLTVDAVSLCIGLGEAKIVLTVGNGIRKALYVSAIASDIAAVSVQALNNSAISPETRFNIQMLAVATNLTYLGYSFTTKAAIENRLYKIKNINEVKNDATVSSFISKLIGKGGSSTIDGIPYINGWTKEKLLAIPKGKRPPVSEYLDPVYIKAHVSRFENEGGAFIVRTGSDVEKSLFTAYPAKKYVALKSEMDKLIKEADGDLKKIIDKLDLGDDYLKDGDELYYVIIKPNDKRFRYAMSDGNEIGANQYWTPGGKTASGALEDVLIGSEKLQHNRDWDTYVKFFGEKNVVRIGGKVVSSTNKASLIDANIYIRNGKYVEDITQIDLMGGKVSQLGDNYVNIDLIAERGIKGSVTDLSKYIKPNSIDEIICTSPQADFLEESFKIMKPNSKIYINGTLKNKYFKNIKKDYVEKLGFEIVEEQVPLISKFQNLRFYLSDGTTEMNKNLIKTTILIKK